MRIASCAVVALSLVVAAPAFAQEDPNLPGVRVTITKRSYLDPGRVQPPRYSSYYDTNPNYTSPMRWTTYEGVLGFQRYPLPDPYTLPGQRALMVDFRAPDFLMGE